MTLVICWQDSIGVTGDVGYTCETASYFFLYQVAPLWEKYYVQVKAMDDQVYIILSVFLILLSCGHT